MTYQRVFTKVQAVLPTCVEENNVKPLVEIFSTKISETTKCCVEASVRDYIARQTCKGAKTDLDQLTVFAKISIEAVRHDLCLPTLPVLILSDAFESLTISQCEELFTFVESNVAVWKEDIFFSPCKNQVLRMCNDILRRLSRSQNTIFCGRILLFLARFFPFTERSGLNLISEFNLENVTSFTNMEAMDGDEMDDSNDADVKPIDKTQPQLDYTLYTKFWSLQDFFRNPPQCYQKAPWKMFTTYANDVLEAFASFKLDGTPGCARNTSAPRVTRTTSETAKTNQQIDQYFAKYLTNQKLLDLQFSDANFRRYVLLQMLILTQYLAASIKFKQDLLSEEQTSWVRVTEDRVYQLLAETPPDGDAFVNTVKHILKREDKWNEWKNYGCLEIKKLNTHPFISTQYATQQNGKDDEDDGGRKTPVKRQRLKRHLGDLVRDADTKRKFIMGNNEMTRLWNLCPDNLDACRQSQRDFVPSLETYFSPAVEQIMNKSGVKEQDRLVNNGNFGWRGLRLLACRSPHFFTHSASLIATLPEYLTTMIKKLAKEIPAQVSEEKGEEEDEKEEKEMTGLEQTNGVKEDEEEEKDSSRDDKIEVRAITTEEMKAVAKNLSALGQDKWIILAKKLGFEKDEVEYIETEKKTIEDRAEYLLQLWVDNECDEANKENLLYTLGGLKMTKAGEGVFT